MKQEELNEIITEHAKWLEGPSGKRADLRGADLHGADLDGANLRGASLYRANLYRANLSEADLYGASLYRANLYRANLSGADLYGASLYGANLSGADLCHADLCHADLCHANLCHANLRGADLAGANLPVGMYQIVGPGSCNRCTTYDAINDRVICGCWDDEKGNHLYSFIDRVENIYGLNGEKPNSVYYTEYMATINFFKTMKELKENRDR